MKFVTYIDLQWGGQNMSVATTFSPPLGHLRASGANLSRAIHRLPSDGNTFSPPFDHLPLFEPPSGHLLESERWDTAAA